MKPKGKTETLEEFLARNGTIKLVPMVKQEPNVEITRQTTGGTVKILTLEEAELYLSKGRAKKPSKVKPNKSTLDLSALPEALRKKFIERYGELKDEETETREKN